MNNSKLQALIVISASVVGVTLWTRIDPISVLIVSGAWAAAGVMLSLVDAKVFSDVPRYIRCLLYFGLGAALVVLSISGDLRRPPSLVALGAANGSFYMGFLIIISRFFHRGKIEHQIR